MKIGLDCPYCRQSFCLCSFDDTLPVAPGIRARAASCPGCGCLFCRCPPPVPAVDSPPTSNIRVGRDTPTDASGDAASRSLFFDRDGDPVSYHSDDEHLLARNFFGPVERV